MSWKRHTCYFFVCMNPIGVEIFIMMVSAMSDIESMCRSQQRRSCELQIGLLRQPPVWVGLQ
jgi:hypothetical protein